MAYTKEIQKRRNEMFSAVEKIAKVGGCELSLCQINKLCCLFFYQTDYRGYMVHLLPKEWKKYDSEYIRSHYSPNSVPIGSQVW